MPGLAAPRPKGILSFFRRRRRRRRLPPRQPTVQPPPPPPTRYVSQSRPPLQVPVEDFITFRVHPSHASDDCPICLDPLSTQLVTTGQCLHLVHTTCLSSWLRHDINWSCPVCRHPLTTNTVVPRETNDHLDHYLDDLADGIVHDNDNDHDDDDSDMGDDIFVDDAFLDIDSIIEEPLDADGVDAMTQRLASPLSCSLDDLHEFFNDHTVADDESVLAESFAQQQFWAYEDRHGGDGEDNGTWGDALFEGDDDWDIYNELGWDSARMRDSLSQIDILLERLRV